MHCKHATIVIHALLLAVPNARCLGISSKLDFGDEEPPKIVSQRQALVSFKPASDGGFEGIGIVCTSGGCNRTNSANARANVKISDKTDTITADVLVQVKTKISFDEKSKNASVADDVGDVPVVVGYAGASNKPEEPSKEEGRTFIPAPVIPISYERPFAEIDQKIVAERVHVPHSPNLNVEPKIPYFEPAFNNHYYSEHVPAQLVWYPKNSVSYNPVEYKTNKQRTWNPNNNEVWAVKIPASTYHNVKYHHHGSAHCDCQNQNGDLSWYPSSRSRKTFQQDPGSQINDKLAPLD